MISGRADLCKGAMVSNSTLAALCIWSGLQEHLMFESYHLGNSIQAYADQLKAKQAEEHELATRDNRAPGQYWLEIDPPKVWSFLTQPVRNWMRQQALSDVVESIVGAIYISDNFSLVGAEAFFRNVLKPFYDRYITLKTLSHHPTKILFELFQAQGCQQFQITKEKNQDVVCCEGKTRVNLGIV
jgi:endoribonuclease Dicer